MRCVVAFILLASSVTAQDFNWAVDDTFSWTLTEKGGGHDLGGTDVTSSSAGQFSETPALESCVHRISVSNGSQGGQGSATHIGDGVFLTCRHVFDRQWRAVKIGDAQVEATATVAKGPDFAVVRTDVASHAAAPVSTSPLSDGQTLHVYGATTGLHTGVLSHRRWSHGYRAVVCPVPTESGDSGAGVFNAAGELVGVHWGSTGNEVFFTPLSEVQDLLTPGSVADLPASTATEPSTSICPCLGYRGRAHCYCLQRGVACKCNRTTGSEWVMSDGKPVKKTGKYANPNNVAVTPSAPFSPAAGSSPSPPGADKPSITIHVADFACPPCEQVKRYDWRDFNVLWVTGGAASYPQIRWQDARGVTRVLTGAYRPDQVRWSWERTQ